MNTQMNEKQKDGESRPLEALVMLNIDRDELGKWVADICDKIESQPASKKQTELAETFEAFVKRLKLDRHQIHSLRLAKAKCTQCLDTGFYYGGHYGAVRMQCTHPEKYSKEAEAPELVGKYLV